MSLLAVVRERVKVRNGGFFVYFVNESQPYLTALHVITTYFNGHNNQEFLIQFSDLTLLFLFS